MFSKIDEQLIIEEVCSAFPKFRKNRDKYEFVCPEEGCPDKTKPAHKNPHGNFFVSRQTGHYFYHCYLCGASMSFISFMRKYAPHKVGKLAKDKLFASSAIKAQKTVETVATTNNECSISRAITEIDLTLEDIKDLAINDLGLKIADATKWMQKKRAVEYDKAFLVSSAAKLYKALTGKNTPLNDDVAGVFLPCMNPHGNNLLGFTIRTITRKDQEKPRLRYVTASFLAQPKNDDNVITRPVFGLDLIDTNDTIYITEGPFDALSINNCVAAISSDLHKAAKMAFGSKCDVVLVFDNEPYHEATTAKMKQAIKMGYDIILFPYGWPKDLNEMIMEFGKDKVQHYIKNNRIPNIKAMAAFTRWKTT